MNIDAATIKIEQRVWHQDIGLPKSEDSRRLLGIGDLSARYREKAIKDGASADAWVFHQHRAPERHCGIQVCEMPYTELRRRKSATSLAWDHTPSAVRISRGANRSAAVPLKLPRSPANSDLEMTGDYTFVTAERQNELTRRIQQKLAKVGKKLGEQAPATSTVSESSQHLETATLATTIVQ